MNEFTAPGYYNKFICIAGWCRDSCCRAGWEITLDEETYRIYKQAGIEDIDDNITIGSDGDMIFKLRENGECPYFEDTGLCRLYKQMDGKLCNVCENYPRFFEEYDGFVEAGLSISCMEAQRLILSAQRSDYNIEGEQPKEELLAFLHSARKTAFDLAFAPFEPNTCAEMIWIFTRRIRQFIKQDWLDFRAFDLLAKGITAIHGRRRVQASGECIYAAQAVLRSTNILYPEWRELLIRAERGEGYNYDYTVSDGQKRAYLAYLVYRFFLKAVKDGDTEAVGWTISGAYFLAVGLPSSFEINTRLFSKEIEHDSENMKMIMDAISGRDGKMTYILT